MNKIHVVNEYRVSARARVYMYLTSPGEVVCQNHSLVTLARRRASKRYCGHSYVSGGRKLPFYGWEKVLLVKKPIIGMIFDGGA